MKTILEMTESQYEQIRDFVPEQTIGFGLLGQVRLHDREIDIVLLTPQQCRKLKGIFKKMGLAKGKKNEKAIY